MTLNSALGDLRATTLKAIRGCLRRLEYLAGLHRGTKGYWHWGLSRVYGELSADKALTQAHRAVVSEILTTPLQVLSADAEASSGEAEIPQQAYLQSLQARARELLPPEPGAGTEKHLSSVLHALAALQKVEEDHKPDATPPAS
jgi:hypothetical protein